MIVWREKFLATAVHFLVTLTLAAAAAALIFLVWFPDPLQTMIGGTELFMLVVGCDLALGPLISLVIYNSRKKRRTLIIDYAIVGAVQIAALAYGVYILAGSRPVYIAYSADRLEIVTARDIPDKELAAAHDAAYRSLPLTGPRYVGVVVPVADRMDAITQALSGNEEHMRPKFYVPYDSQRENILAHAKTLETLTREKPESKPLLEEALRSVSVPRERLRWLPAHHSKGFWTALIDVNDGRPVTYFDFEPD